MRHNGGILNNEQAKLFNAHLMPMNEQEKVAKSHY